MNFSAVLKLKDSSIVGKSVVYVMSRDQRVRDNIALFEAQKYAIERNLPFAVVFCLYPAVLNRAREHYEFMLEGLLEVEKDLKKFNIPLFLMIGDPVVELNEFILRSKADALFFDFSPLRGPRRLVEKVKKANNLNVFLCDGHNIVPAWILSDRKEMGARTIRIKIHKQISNYLIEPEQIIMHPTDWPYRVQSLKELRDAIKDLLSGLPRNRVKKVVESGEQAAFKVLKGFVDNRLQNYATLRNEPALDSQSGLSPYLHFGQISALRITLLLRSVAAQHDSDLHITNSKLMPHYDRGKTETLNSIDAFIEELVVRRELSDNYCFYEKEYDSLNAASNWAKTTLSQHKYDKREFLYTLDQFEEAQTHDRAWNAAQQQLRLSGKIHGYMRMYWGKKVLEWSKSPEEAIKIIIRLNDFYSLDGADPNGYAGIMWSVAGVHDRAWTERLVFGKIRYMNYSGLKRKFDISAYENKWLGNPKNNTSIC